MWYVVVYGGFLDLYWTDVALEPAWGRWVPKSRAATYTTKEEAEAVAGTILLCYPELIGVVQVVEG
jgi:hypothetical protein